MVRDELAPDLDPVYGDRYEADAEHTHADVEKAKAEAHALYAKLLDLAATKGQAKIGADAQRRRRARGEGAIFYGRRDRDGMLEGHVYVLRATESGIYKIGVSSDPERRLKDWQRRFIEPLELVAVIEDGGERLERELHERFADQRVEPSGTVEAFYPCDELEALVEEHAV